MNRITMLAFAIASFSVSTGVEAQRASAQRGSASSSAKRAELLAPTTGITLGVYGLAARGVSVSGPDVEGTFSTSLGQGLGVSLDYGFNQTFSLFASLDIAKQKTSNDSYPEGEFGLAHFEFGARANLRLSDPKTVPYLSAAVGARGLGANVKDLDTGERFDWGMSGAIASVGGGIRRYISPSLALDGGVELAYGSFNRINDDGDDYPVDVNRSSSMRFRFGISWHP